jgi:hypothetical protein
MLRKPKVLNPNETYTFATYSDLPFEREEILADLGCTISTERLILPRYDGDLQLQDLSDRLLDAFRFITINRMQARREFLVAPIISHLCRHTQKGVRVEYALIINRWLQGTLDYYFQANNLLLLEARQENLYTGFTQLGAELVALDQWADNEAPIIYGVVTTGQLWQFGRFERTNKHLVEDLTLYRIPEDLERVLRILIGIIVS